VTRTSGSDVVSTEPTPAVERSDATARVLTPQALLTRAPVWLWFPLFVVLATVVLGSLKLTQSSVSVFGPDGEDRGLVAGRARPQRTDEWLVRTPLVARQVALGLPRDDQMGVGRHDMAVSNDLPTGGWDVVARPHLLPYHVFGIERAFAFEWWIVLFALPGIGFYTLALVLGVRWLTAALVAMIVILSPVVQWWTVTSTGTTIGYAFLASATLIGATRARSRYAQVGLAAAAGWSAACLVCVLYPPWAVPLFLIGGVTAAAAISASYPQKKARRAWWHRLLLVGGVAAAVGGVLVVAFALAHRDAFEAITNAVYPGQRRSVGGTGDLSLVFGAPFDIIEATKSLVVVTVNGVNQSEASAGLFTAFAVAAAALADPTRSLLRPWRNRVVFLAVLGVLSLLLAWYLLPIPEGIGRLLLLDRVPTERIPLPLAASGGLLFALFIDVYRRPGNRTHPRALVAGTVAFAVPMLWAGGQLRIDGDLVPRWQVLLLALAATAGIALALSGRRVGLWVLVALFAVGAATVNPLQHGLRALTDSPAADLGRELRARPDTGVVAMFFQNPSGDLEPLAGLTASGVPLASGVNEYPNAAAWTVLDPDGVSRDAWDRYNTAIWTPGPPGSKPDIRLSPPAALAVFVDPCDPRLAKLAVRTIVSDHELTDPCLTEIMRTAGTPILYAYRITRD
jgi:hypothetical protein